MDQDRPLTESEFKKILTVQMDTILDMLVTIGTLNAVLADQGVLPMEKMTEARSIVERLPKLVTLRKLVSEIQDSPSISDILKNFHGTIQ
jgi:hypothetical protein